MTTDKNEGSNIAKKAGKLLVKLRKEKGLSQEAVAYDNEIDKHYMSDIELGKRNFSMNILNRLCQYHGISLREFFTIIEKGE